MTAFLQVVAYTNLTHTGAKHEGLQCIFCAAIDSFPSDFDSTFVDVSNKKWRDKWLKVAYIDEWRKATHEKSKVSMLKLVHECDAESSCAFLKLKSARRMMLKLAI